jgi:membrane associated rhomboid family serine protease
MLTFIIIAITALVSIAAFSNDALFNRLILWPRRMDKPAEYYRLLTSGFIHADWNHLIFNMFALYVFGGLVEGLIGGLFIVLYLTGIVIASLPSFLKNRNNGSFRSLGASGGVAAVVFFNIYFDPWNRIFIFFIPIGIPSVLFAAGYLLYSVIMSRRGRGTINHDAHLWGSLYGLFFAFLVDPSHGRFFIYALTNPRW